MPTKPELQAQLEALQAENARLLAAQTPAPRTPRPARVQNLVPVTITNRVVDENGVLISGLLRVGDQTAPLLERSVGLRRTPQTIGVISPNPARRTALVQLNERQADGAIVGNIDAHMVGWLATELDFVPAT